MKAQLASDYAEDRAGDAWASSPTIALAPASLPYEYGIYGQSRRANPAAAAASILVAAGAFASFLFIGGHHHHHHREHRLSVMELVDLQPPPPPPSQAPSIIKPHNDTLPEIIVPPALVVMPAAVSPVMTVAQPAPSPVPSGRSEVHAPVSPPAPPSQETSNVGDLSARMISATPPSYPLESRRSLEQGTVVLAVQLSIDGRVASVTVSKTSGSPRLDRAALSAVKHWRWAPMVRNGNPVLVQGMVTIPFVLRMT